MKTIYTEIFNKEAEGKYPKSETEPTNPWAVCTDKVGREDKDKYERCVHHIKDQNRKENKKKAGIDDMKDIKGRTFQFRSDGTTRDDFDKNLRDEMSGQADEDKSRKLDDIWLDALRRQRAKEQEPVFAFVVKRKNK